MWFLPDKGRILRCSQAAALISPLRDAWTPGGDGEDDRDTQEIVSRMLAEIKQGGEEARL